MMKISDYRKMRAIILFDLPSVEKQDMANNQKFIKKLKKIKKPVDKLLRECYYKQAVWSKAVRAVSSAG